MKNLLRRSVLALTPAFLALALILPATAVAATPPNLRLSWSLPGNHDVKLAITGANARAWRLTGAGTSTLANYKVQITINTGDVSFNGDVSYLRRSATGAWQVFAKYNISPYLGSKTASIGGCESHLRLCWNTASMVLPVNGNVTFGARLHSQAIGRAFGFSGAVRRAGSEPFVWGPWVSTSTVVLRP